jgi:class 3 adenylate cyclase
MPERPTGTVTFLFSDIEGSTRLLQQLRDRYSDVLSTHARLLREAIEQFDGYDRHAARRVLRRLRART